MVLFEGTYSGVIFPNKHYIPLKKDFSNVDDVFRMLSDDEFLQQMVERAYEDIIESEKYSYKSFVEEFDQIVEEINEEFFCKKNAITKVRTVIADKKINFYKNLDLQILKAQRKQKYLALIMGVMRPIKRLIKKIVYWFINYGSQKVNC